MLVEWKEEYSVKVKEIDDEHKSIIALLNKLDDDLNSMKTAFHLTDFVNELKNLARKHFETEEKYFKKFNFEFTSEHIAEHDQFWEKIKPVVGISDEIQAAFELRDFLEDWLVDHLITQDQKYVECFKQHGLK